MVNVQIVISIQIVLRVLEGYVLNVMTAIISLAIKCVNFAQVVLQIVHNVAMGILAHLALTQI